jgi:hypothetical protein
VTDIEIREREELMLPPWDGAGQMVDLNNEVECAIAFDACRRLETHLAEARRVLAEAVAARAAVLGTKTILLPGARKAEVRGGTQLVYDANELERRLRLAGMPEDRLREIVREEVTHTVRAVEAKRAAGANPEYARALEAATTEVQRPHSITIRSR